MSERGLAESLPGLAADSRDSYQALAQGSFAFANCFERELEHGLEQAHSGIVNAKLRGVDAHRNSPGAGFAVITGEGALATFIEFAIGVERQWMGRDYDALQQCHACLGIDHGTVYHDQNLPSATSNFVGLSSVGRSFSTQWATHPSRVLGETSGQPSKAWQSDASLRRAWSDSSPRNTGSRPKARA